MLFYQTAHKCSAAQHNIGNGNESVVDSIQANIHFGLRQEFRRQNVIVILGGTSVLGMTSSQHWDKWFH